MLNKQRGGVPSSRQVGYLSQYQVPVAQPSQRVGGGRMRWWIFGGLSTAVAGLVAFVIPEISRPSVIHFALDDHSGSALDLSAERQLHCEASVPHYRAGDRRQEYIFADIPTEVNEYRIDNTLLFNPCVELDSRVADIGRQDGTSVIRLIERVDGDVSKLRVEKPDQRVVATMMLHYAEVVGDQPRLDEEGLERLQAAVSTIIGDDLGAIAIVGPTGELQNQLQQIFQDTPRVKICGFQSTEACVNWAFETVR